MALAANGPSEAIYDAPPGEKRNYDEWITETKRKETRDKHVVQAVEWLVAGRGVTESMGSVGDTPTRPIT